MRRCNYPVTQRLPGATLFPLLAPLLALGLGACTPDDPDKGTQSGPERVVAPLSDSDAKVVTLSDAEADSAAERAHQEVRLEPEEGLEVKLWASEKLLGDPVAINVDYQGRVWASVTNRSNNSEFDIRFYPDWEIPSMAFQTVEDRRAFLREELAPKKSLDNIWLEDRNSDGSHDWRDLAVVKEEVILLEDTSDNGRANRSRVFLKDFHSEVTDVLGAIYYHNRLDELFLGVAPNAWRVKDADGDLRADHKTALSEGFGVHIGFSGHGMSGMTLGPDGRIYYGIGDIGFNSTDLDGKKWAYPNQGVVVRSEPDGSNFEVFAAGVRNTHEIAFDRYGNLISVDNDGDHEGEYERVVYLVDGSDSGWRTNWQLGKYKDPKNNRYKVWMDEAYYKPRFEDQAAHLLPPIAPYHAGPTGMVYNPGTGLGEKWQNHFFVAEFVGSAPRSGINAFTLEPEGASFKLSTDRNVFRGLQVTGLDFGPDGALYMGDWVEGWNTNGTGRVWKLDVVEGVDSEQRRETRVLLAADFASLDTDVLRRHLRHPDMRVRQKAQFELVARGDSTTLETVAVTDDHQLARIHAIWGLGQMARQGSDQGAVLAPLLTDEDPEIRAQVAKVQGDIPYNEATSELVARLSDDNLRVRFFAAQALGRIGDEETQEPLVGMLAANDDQDVYLRQAGAIALARIGDESTLGDLAGHASEAVRIAAVVALRRLESPELARFLQDKSEFVVTNAARAITDDHFVDDAIPELAELLEAPPYTNEPLLRRLINANLYAGGEASAERLLAFARRQDIVGAIRAEALDTLSVWPESSVFDRVTGRYRGAVNHPQAQARDLLAAHHESLLDDSSAEVRVAAVRAVSALQIDSATARLVRALKEDRSPAVRVGALEALHRLKYEAMGELALAAMNDAHQDVRMAALELVPELGLPVTQVVELHRLLLQNGEVEEQQSAYRSLASVDHESAHQLLSSAMDQLMEDNLPVEVQLDLIEAVEATGSESLQEKLASYEASKDRNEPLDVYREALRGGDARVGYELYRHSNQAQCIRCHVVRARGSRVGPDLTDIGARLSRAQLLEAMVDPGARVAPGHGQVTVTLEGGRIVSGLFEAETGTTMTIVEEGESVQVAKADVVDTTYSGSGMPPMGQLLSRGQLRDLVEFLSTLTGEEDTGSGH